MLKILNLTTGTPLRSNATDAEIKAAKMMRGWPFYPLDPEVRAKLKANPPKFSLGPIWPFTRSR